MRNTEGLLKVNEHLWHIASEAAAKRPIRSTETVAVVFSAIAIESYVNNLLETLSYYVNIGTKMPVRLRILSAIASGLEVGRAQLPEKVNLISSVLRGHDFDKGKNPYQEFDLLLAIRHRFVHSRPSRLKFADVGSDFSVVGEQKRIRQGLVDRGLINPAALKFGWEAVFGGGQTGEWAVQTAYNMARAIGDCFPKGKWRRWAQSENPLSREAQELRERATPVLPKNDGSAPA